MQTIENIVRRILVDGSNASGRRVGWKNWLARPNWPPDFFAVVGTLAELPGSYADPPFMSPWQGGYASSDEYRRRTPPEGA